MSEFYEVLRGRRDVRTGFLPEIPVADDALRRVLEAAHAAPSVGFSQPWDFVVVRSVETRRAVADLVRGSGRPTRPRCRGRGPPRSAR